MSRNSAALVRTLLALCAVSVGCSKSSSSTRFDVSIVVDPALALDAVHIVAAATGKTPLEKDFAPAANLQWTVVVPNPGSSFMASFVATGLAGSSTVVTYAASASVGASKTVAVLLRLDATCASVICGDPTQTCSNGVCVMQTMFGTSAGSGGAPAAGAGGGTAIGTGGGGAIGTGGQTPAGGAGGGAVPVGTGGAGNVPADAGVPDAPMDMATPPVCATGTHMCPGGCVADDDIRTCGTSCTPCQAPTDGTATCDGMSCGGTCASGKKLCLGTCIDQAASCDGMCPAQQHACSGLCPSVNDVKACGTSCLPCPVPVGATQATCDGTKCDFQCTTGTHKCTTECASDTDVAACGASCAVCSTDPNGTPQCVGGVCGIACKMGYHTCSGRCVSNSLVTSCGTLSCDDCTAPTGGTVACNGTMCVPSCPPGQKVCSGACIDAAMACLGSCPSGTHDCSGICAMNNSTDSCGSTPTACASCPKPTGADQTSCDGTSCDFTCGSGYHRCGSTCAADSDPTACGTTCLNCVTDPNGAPACVSGGCGLKCNNGFHICGGKCVDNKTVTMCGPNDNTSCTACTAPSGGGTVSCDGLACVPACPTGKLCNGVCISTNTACMGMCPDNTHNCSGLCQPNDSTTYCGAGCNSCAAPPSNGSAVCTGTPAGCAVNCNNGFMNCPATGQCAPKGGCCADSDCTSLPAPNMVGACLGGSCSYSCGSAYRPCNSGCIAKTGSCCSTAECTSPQTCNASNMCSCTSAAMTTTCSGKCGTVADNCGVAVNCGGCGSGQLCGADNKCASCGAVGQTCCTGSTCTGSGVACTSSTCQCQANYHLCGTACASNSLTSSCGPTSCSACPTVANGAPTCTGSGPACGISCNAGYMSCTSSGACILDHWDFEDGSRHGFQGPGPNALLRLNSSIVHGTSVFSLQIDANPGPVSSGGGFFALGFPVTSGGECPSSTDYINREGKTLSGWIYLVNPPAGSTVEIDAHSTARGAVVVTTVAVASNTWFSFSGVTTNVGTVDYFTATLIMPGGASYSGSFYIDDLAWK